MTTQETIDKLEETILNAQIAIEDAMERIEELKHKQPKIKVGSVFISSRNDCVYALAVDGNQIVFKNLSNHNTYERTLNLYKYSQPEQNDIYIPLTDFLHVVRGQKSFIKIDPHSAMKKVCIK